MIGPVSVPMVCEECFYDGPVTVEWDGGFWEWECPECGEFTEGWEDYDPVSERLWRDAY